MDTHSPPPWTIDHNHPDDPETATIHDPSGEWVAQTDEANAARIVHCVNNHDALLAALEAMVDMEDWSQEDIDPQSTVGRAYAAIAAAKGEA